MGRDEKSRAACRRHREAQPGAFFPAALFPGLAKSHESANWRSVFKARPSPSLAGSSKPAWLWLCLGESVKGFLSCSSMGTSLGATQRDREEGGAGGHLRPGHLGGRREGAGPGGLGGAERRHRRCWKAWKLPAGMRLEKGGRVFRLFYFSFFSYISVFGVQITPWVCGDGSLRIDRKRNGLGI